MGRDVVVNGGWVVGMGPDGEWVVAGWVVVGDVVDGWWVLLVDCE